MLEKLKRVTVLEQLLKTSVELRMKPAAVILVETGFCGKDWADKIVLAQPVGVAVMVLVDVEVNQVPEGVTVGLQEDVTVDVGVRVLVKVAVGVEVNQVPVGVLVEVPVFVGV